MKILIIRMYADCLNIKNYNCQEIGLAKALVRNGNTCDIVLYTDKKEAYEEDLFFDNNNKKIHIYYFKAKKILKNCFFQKELYDIIKKYDRVQTAEYDQIANVKLRKIVGEKLVIYHGPYMSKYTKGYNLKCMISDFFYMFNKEYKNTKCFAKSFLAEDFLRKKGFRRIETVGVGLDTDRFNIQTGENCRNEKTIKLKLKKEKEKLKYILYIGRIEDRRNILFLLDIFEKIHEKNDNVRLIIIGKGEKKYINKCIKKAKSKKIDNAIIYIDEMKQEELTDVYKIVDALILPTKYEIFGMVLLEAMYFEIPIITTKNGGSSVLEKDTTANIYIYNNENECLKYIEKVLKEDDKHANKAEFILNDKYTWENISKVMLKS